MDSKLSDYGRRVMASPHSDKPVYPFWSPAPVAAPMLRHSSMPALPQARQDLTALKTQVNQLEQMVAARPPPPKLALPQWGTRPPLLTQTRKPDPKSTQLQMMSLMQEQQRSLTEMIRSMRSSQPVQPQVFTDPQRPTPRVPSLVPQYREIKADPVRFRNLLGEADFNDNEEEMYVDKPRDEPFSLDFTVPQKVDQLARIQRAKEEERFRLLRKRIKGKRRFRCVVLSVLFPIFLYGDTLGRLGKNKSSRLKDMKDLIKVYSEAAKSWLLRVIRMPLTSILSDPDLDLNILSTGGRRSNKPDRLVSKVQKIQVHIRGMLDLLMENTRADLMPRALIDFLRKLVSNRAHLPPRFVLGFERARLDFDAFGAVRNQTRESQQMLIGTFLITRILLANTFLETGSNGLRFTSPLTSEYFVYRNFKILASVLELLVLMAFVRVGQSPERGAADESAITNRAPLAPLPPVGFTQSLDDGISARLFTMGEMKHAFAEMRGWVETTREQLMAWTEEVLRVVFSAGKQ